MFDLFQNNQLQLNNSVNVNKLSKSKKWQNSIFIKCKQLIQQQSNQIQQLTKEIDRKDQIIQSIIIQKQNIKTSLINLQKNLVQKSQKYSNIQEQFKNSKNQIMQLKDLINQKQSKISQLQKEKTLYQQKIFKSQILTQNQAHNTQALKLKIQTLQQTIQLITHQNHYLNNTINLKQQQSNWQIGYLKKFNEQLKKKFQIMDLLNSHQSQLNFQYKELKDKCYNCNHNYSCQLTDKRKSKLDKYEGLTLNRFENDRIYNKKTENYGSNFTLMHSPIKQSTSTTFYRDSYRPSYSFSTDKKLRHEYNDENYQTPNISTNNNRINLKSQKFFKPIKENQYVLQNPNIKPTNLPYCNNNKNMNVYDNTYKNKNNGRTSTHFISQFTPNPEMSRQLNDIKEHISNQYKKIENKKINQTKYNKQKTLKVLQDLEKKAWRLVSQAQKSQDQQQIQ